MNILEVEFDIKEKLNKINKDFPTFSWKWSYKGITSEDNELLEKALVKVKRDFKISYTISIIVLFIFSIVSIAAYLDYINPSNMNKVGVFFLCTMANITFTYRLNNLKLNLENKIYLLNLMTKLGK